MIGLLGTEDLYPSPLLSLKSDQPSGRSSYRECLSTTLAPPFQNLVPQRDAKNHCRSPGLELVWRCSTYSSMRLWCGWRWSTKVLRSRCNDASCACGSSHFTFWSSLSLSLSLNPGLLRAHSLPLSHRLHCHSTRFHSPLSPPYSTRQPLSTCLSLFLVLSIGWVSNGSSNALQWTFILSSIGKIRSLNCVLGRSSMAGLCFRTIYCNIPPEAIWTTSLIDQCSWLS